ncbi:MAG: LysR family transcriptional regulator [Paracoccaceae bacterium]
MDLQLIKTFLEVASTGSFGSAAGRLFVTQSAVSLRVQRLEEQLGRPLFDRNKGGVVLTAAGREFRGFATLILRNWEQARQRVSAMDGLPPALAIGAQPSLWPRFGFRWLDRLRDALPDLAIRADMGRPEALAERVLSGAAQVVLTYQTLIRPGLLTERLMDDQLVLVSPWRDADVASLVGRYVLVDWGPEFMRFHEETYPALSTPRLTLGMGSLAAWYARNRPCGAYLPARFAAQFLADEVLFLVKDAPSFAYVAWAVWREDLDLALRDVARKTLSAAVSEAEGNIAGVLDLL